MNHAKTPLPAAGTSENPALPGPAIAGSSATAAILALRSNTANHGLSIGLVDMVAKPETTGVDLKIEWLSLLNDKSTVEPLVPQTGKASSYKRGSTRQPLSLQPSTGQPLSLQPSTGQPLSMQPSTGQPSKDQTILQLDLFAGFDFGTVQYIPLDSLKQTLSATRLLLGSPMQYQAAFGHFPASAGDAFCTAYILWAWAEADLNRFARDPHFIMALEASRQRDVTCYLRFARLNDLYRALVAGILPWGIAPSAWSGWLQGRQYRPVLPGRLRRNIDSRLVPWASGPTGLYDKIVRLLLNFGAKPWIIPDAEPSS
jgi:hypothetical protein